MAPQAPTIKATSNRPADITGISIKNTNNIDIMWLKENIQQLMDNQTVIKKQLNTKKHQPVKMLAIKKFNRN